MLDLLGGRSVTISEPPPTDDDWYLNLVWIERQKCLLLTHTAPCSPSSESESASQIFAHSATISSRPSRQSSAKRAFPPTRSQRSSLTASNSRRPRAAARSAP